MSEYYKGLWTGWAIAMVFGSLGWMIGSVVFG